MPEARPSRQSGERSGRAQQIMDGAEAIAGRLGERFEGRRPWRRPGEIMMNILGFGVFTMVLPLALGFESWDSYRLEYHGSPGQVIVVKDLTDKGCECAEVRFPDRPPSIVYDLRMSGPVRPGSIVAVRYLPSDRSVLRPASEEGWNWIPAAVAPAATGVGVLIVILELRNLRRVRDYYADRHTRR